MVITKKYLPPLPIRCKTVAFMPDFCLPALKKAVNSSMQINITNMTGHRGQGTGDRVDSTIPWVIYGPIEPIQLFLYGVHMQLVVTFNWILRLLAAVRARLGLSISELN